MDSVVAHRGPLARAGTILLLAGLAIATLPLLTSPALADVDNSQGSPPVVECSGLDNYLDKFDFEEDAGGSFDQDTGNAANTDTPPAYAYASSTGVTVAFTEDDEGEVHSVDWTSTTPVSLIWVKAGDDTDEGEYYAPAKTSGTVSVPTDENSLGHVTFCLRSQVEVIKVFTDTDGTFPTEQPDPIPAFLVEVYDGILPVGDPVASDFPAATAADRSGIVESGQYTVTEDAIDGYGEVACADEVTTEFGATSSGTGTFTAPELGTAAVHVVCNAPGTTPTPEAPQFTVSAGCDETDGPIVTVTVTSNPDDELIQVEITGEDPVTITETTVFDEGDAFDVLTATYGETQEEATFRDDCGPAEFLESTAGFTTGSQCQSGLPVLTYDATISETADDPVGDVTLTVVDADGVERADTTFSETAAGNLPMPTDLEGATVTVGWDFDDTTTEQQLASDCGDVLGAVDEREEEPAALPATEVKGEQLPNAGFEEDLLLVLGGGFLALGCSLLLYDRRRYGVTA